MQTNQQGHVARRAGPSKTEFEAMVRQVREEERRKRAHQNEVRETAWLCYTAHEAYRWPWWRIGFQRKLAKVIETGGDVKNIPKYDTLHQEVAGIFPEYDTPDGIERLWEFLMSPFDPMPKREALERIARRRLDEQRRQQRRDAAVDFPFGANACGSF